MKNPALGLDETIRGAPSQDGIADPDADSPAFVAKTEADVAQNDVRATALGEAAAQLVAAYEATLPDDGGEAAATQPAATTCSASTSRRSSGSAGRTTPTTRTSACSGAWAASGCSAADMTRRGRDDDRRGPTRPRTRARRWPTGRAAWSGAGRRTSSPSSRGSTCPAASGRRRRARTGSSSTGGGARAARPSRTPCARRRSASARWAGITVEDVRLETDGRVSFRVGPRRSDVTHFDQGENPGNPIQVPVELGPIDYPDSYEKTRGTGAGGASSPRRGATRATRTRPATRPGSSCTASSARSGRGPTPATPRARP